MIDTWQKVCVFLTRNCNLKCRGCNVINYKVSYELSTKEWYKAFDILKKYNVGFVVLFGGEPTLREDLPELVKYLNKLELPHTIITNSVRMNKDEEYYQKIIEAKPFGISCSVNAVNNFNLKYSDELKSQEGVKLLLRLKEDLPDCDLVANMAVTSKNIQRLPLMVKHFSRLGMYSILTFLHLVDEHHSSYWLYRGTDDMDLIKYEEGDIKLVSEWFLAQYKYLLLHNSKEYFEQWTTFGETQNWNCSHFTCPAINPDGLLLSCVDRKMTKPFTIFDLPKKEKEILESFNESIKTCPGCFWDHMFETNMYADKGQIQLAKDIFAHKEIKGDILHE